MPQSAQIWSIGVMAYLINSIPPGVVIHGLGLLIFFVLVWPADRSRQLVADGGGGAWFCIHTGQAIVFTMLAILAFKHLARVTQDARARRASGRKPVDWIVEYLADYAIFLANLANS